MARKQWIEKNKSLRPQKNWNSKSLWGLEFARLTDSNTGLVCCWFLPSAWLHPICSSLWPLGSCYLSIPFQSFVYAENVSLWPWTNKSRDVFRLEVGNPTVSQIPLCTWKRNSEATITHSLQVLYYNLQIPPFPEVKLANRPVPLVTHTPRMPLRAFGHVRRSRDSVSTTSDMCVFWWRFIGLYVIVGQQDYTSITGSSILEDCWQTCP